MRRRSNRDNLIGTERPVGLGLFAGVLSGSDPRVEAWEDSRWPAAAVAPPPPELVVLFRHVTGRDLSISDFELLERLRGHTGYGGAHVRQVEAAADPSLREAPHRALETRGPDDGSDDFGDVGDIRGSGDLDL